jgi:hypothetical protein
VLLDAMWVADDDRNRVEAEIYVAYIMAVHDCDGDTAGRACGG